MFGTNWFELMNLITEFKLRLLQVKKIHFSHKHMHGGKKFISNPSPFEECAICRPMKRQQSKKKYREKKVFLFILTIRVIVFLACKPNFYDKFLHLPLISNFVSSLIFFQYLVAYLSR